MAAFDRAWTLLKMRKLPDPPAEKPPPCPYCGNTETQWKMDGFSRLNWTLEMTDTVPYYSVWCKNWFAQEGEDGGCEKLSYADSFAEMQIKDTWRNAFDTDREIRGDEGV